MKRKPSSEIRKVSSIRKFWRYNAKPPNEDVQRGHPPIQGDENDIQNYLKQNKRKRW